jgi:hypothetical protein
MVFLCKNRKIKPLISSVKSSFGYTETAIVLQIIEIQK